MLPPPRLIRLHLLFRFLYASGRPRHECALTGSADRRRVPGRRRDGVSVPLLLETRTADFFFFFVCFLPRVWIPVPGELRAGRKPPRLRVIHRVNRFVRRVDASRGG